MGNILYRRAAGSCRIETRFHNGGRLFDRLRRRILHLRRGIEEILFRHRKVIVDVQFVRGGYGFFIELDARGNDVLTAFGKIGTDDRAAYVQRFRRI